MNQAALDELRMALSIKAKNGVDFIFSASIIWVLISLIWASSYSAYDKSVLTFIVGSGLLPLALLLSKVLKTQWKQPDNPLSPLGLWLNFAQLFYFPFLIFVLIKSPTYFVMTYAIITGAHLFPYAWFYQELSYAVAAGVSAVGALLLALFLPDEDMFYIPLFMSACLLILALLLYRSYKIKAAT